MQNVCEHKISGKVHINKFNLEKPEQKKMETEKPLRLSWIYCEDIMWLDKKFLGFLLNYIHIASPPFG